MSRHLHGEYIFILRLEGEGLFRYGGIPSRTLIGMVDLQKLGSNTRL